MLRRSKIPLATSPSGGIGISNGLSASQVSPGWVPGGAGDGREVPAWTAWNCRELALAPLPCPDSAGPRWSLGARLASMCRVNPGSSGGEPTGGLDSMSADGRHDRERDRRKVQVDSKQKQLKQQLNGSVPQIGCFVR